jgi:protein-tyrosine-phosphatase
VRRRLGRAVGKRVDNVLLASSLRDVLFVCHGNIMRSAMAAALFREELRRSAIVDVTIHSAGLAATAGLSADSRARLIADGFGISLESHRATPVSRELVAGADIVLVMDWRNEAEMLARFPELSHKILMLGALAPNSFDDWPSIRDPFTRSDAEAELCFHRIQAAVVALASQVRASRSLVHDRD